MPFNDLQIVRRLSRDESRCEFFAPVLAELRRRGLDTDDLRDIIGSELGDGHCHASKPTVKYHPGTTSDYYSIYVPECGCPMFIKLLVAVDPAGNERLVVTSFKKDVRHA